MYFLSNGRTKSLDSVVHLFYFYCSLKSWEWRPWLISAPSLLTSDSVTCLRLSCLLPDWSPCFSQTPASMAPFLVSTSASLTHLDLSGNSVSGPISTLSSFGFFIGLKFQVGWSLGYDLSTRNNNMTNAWVLNQKREAGCYHYCLMSLKAWGWNEWNAEYVGYTLDFHEIAVQLARAPSWCETWINFVKLWGLERSSSLFILLQIRDLDGV